MVRVWCQAEVKESLAHLLPDAMSHTMIQQLPSRVGQCTEDHAKAVAEAVQQTAPLDTQGATSWRWVGTGCVPLREDAPKRGRPAERPGGVETDRVPTAWKEARVGMVATHATPDDPETQTAERVDVRYEARMPETKMATLIGGLVEQTEHVVDAGAYSHRALLLDGKREIWRCVDEHLFGKGSDKADA